VFAYVIMPDHTHLLTDQPDKPSNLLRYIKGTVAHRIIEYLKDKNYHASLEKLRHEEWKRNHRYSLWRQEKNVFSVISEAVFMQICSYSLFGAAAIRKATPEKARASKTAVVSLELRRSAAALGMCRIKTHRKIIKPVSPPARRDVGETLAPAPPAINATPAHSGPTVRPATS